MSAVEPRMQRWRNNTDVANTKHEVRLVKQRSCVACPMSLTSRRVQVPPQLMKRAASVLSARPKRSVKRPKSYAEETVALEEESRQADLAKSADRSNRRGFTNGFADPLKKYEGSYKSPAVPAPPRARVSTPMDLEGPEPQRGADGAFRFKGWPQFLPNLSPAEVMRRGSFGGTYFRKIFSSATGEAYTNAADEFPDAWWRDAGLGRRQLTSATYDASLNRFGVSCGGSLDMWESSGWVNAVDPYGWFQWYCRFFLGRRCDDDARQIDRWRKCAGPKGRFRNQLIGKCAAARRPFDDASVSPIIRQTLQHWGYTLTQADAERYCKLKGLSLPEPTTSAPVLPSKNTKKSAKR